MLLGYKGLELIDRGALRGVARAGRRRWHASSARTLADTAADLGGLLLKAGQYLSTRTDVLPDAYLRPLTRLQDRVAPHPYGVVRAVLREELGVEPSAVFARLWRRPVASASLAQVHRAVLKDGRHVAVKVQRPEVGAAVRADLRNLRIAVGAVERFEPALRLSLLLDELAAAIPRELDFVGEAASLRRVAANRAGDPGVVIPAPIPELTTRRVLVTEYLAGIKVTDVRSLRRASLDPAAVAQRLLDCYAAQILHDGLFHADPHPGNLMVLADAAAPGGFRIAFVDFGLVEELPEDFRTRARELVAHVLAGDPAGVAATLEALGLETEGSGTATVRRMSELTIELARRKAQPGRVRTRDLGGELLELLRADPLARMPPHLWLIARVLSLLRGVASTLGVELDWRRAVLPYLAGDGR